MTAEADGTCIEPFWSDFFPWFGEFFDQPNFPASTPVILFQETCAGSKHCMNLCKDGSERAELVGKRVGHHDPAGMVDEVDGEVVSSSITREAEARISRVRIAVLMRGGEPSLPPRQRGRAALLELFKFFDDGRGHREFADRAKPEKNDHFLAVVYPRREAEGVGVWR